MISKIASAKAQIPTNIATAKINAPKILDTALFSSFELSLILSQSFLLLSISFVANFAVYEAVKICFADEPLAPDAKESLNFPRTNPSQNSCS